MTKTELTVFSLGKQLSDGACQADKVLTLTLGMTPTIAWGVAKDRFIEAFGRKPTVEDELDFRAGFGFGLLENQKKQAALRIKELGG